jgi:cystathionine beta-lyase/cystathionine gamma-synthase
MEKSTNNAKNIAQFLDDRSDVGQVYYPGLESHPQHGLAKSQMNDFGAMVSFTLEKDDAEATKDFTSRTHLFALAESLGGVESLINHPSSMTHASIPRETRYKAGLKDSLIRLSVGIEDADDLVQDLEKAFE